MTMMVPVEGSMKNGDLPSVIVGLGVGLLDALTRSPGGFCSPPLKHACFQFPHVFHMFSAEHGTLERQVSCIFAEGFGISSF